MATFIIFGLIFVLLVPNTFYMLTDLIHLNQFTFDFYVQLNIMEWLYFTYLLLGVFFSNVLYDSYIYKFDAFYFKIMDKSNSNCSTYVLKWFRYLYGTLLRFHTVHLITEPFTIIRQVIASLNTQSITFILLMVLLQTVIIIFVKG